MRASLQSLLKRVLLCLEVYFWVQWPLVLTSVCMPFVSHFQRQHIQI
jgi:hypothetical protein